MIAARCMLIHLIFLMKFYSIYIFYRPLGKYVPLSKFISTVRLYTRSEIERARNLEPSPRNINWIAIPINS